MKHLFTRSISALAFFACMTSALAQINYGGEPTFIVNAESITASTIVLPSIDRETKLES